MICIGAIHLDTIAHAGETIRPETSTPAAFVSRPGGVAANVARALARLGVEAHLVGTVGDDAAARELTRRLTLEGVKLAHVPRPGHTTGQYLALHDPDGTLAAACVDDRVLSEAPCDLFDPVLDDLIAASAPETIWFLDANLPAPMLAHITGRITGGRIVANAVSDAKAPRLQPVLPRLDCLLLNRGEAAALTGLAQETGAEDLANALARTGVRSLVLTSGAADVLVWEAGSLSRFFPRGRFPSST
ncbi:PfkB family carbohydrate kinase [Roseibium salinum]|nr:PfkB family carbohydrate kinase [Roseibium salinum]